jgi:hypothetical protein
MPKSDFPVPVHPATIINGSLGPLIFNEFDESNLESNDLNIDKIK